MSLATGLAGLGVIGLIGASVTTAWAGSATLLHQSHNQLILSLRRLNSQVLRLALRRHGRNATWSTFVSVMNAVSFNAPVLALAFFYLPREVGWYALMSRLIAAPTGALMSALGQSFWSQSAEYAHANRIAELSNLYRRTTIRLGFACISVAVVCLAGPLFVGPVLGAEDWGGAGYVLMAMTPLFVGMILFSPTNHLVVLDKQHLQLLVDATRLVLILGSIATASYFEMGFAAVVALASLSSFVGHAILFIIHLKVHKDHERR